MGSVAASKRSERTVGAFARSPEDDRIYDCTLVPVCGDDGNAELVAVLARDVTDEQRVQAEVQLRDRRKEDFIALMAHELRNPLAPIYNGLQLMKLSPHDTRIIEQVLAMMDRQLGHLVRLIDDLLDVSRVTKGKLELRLEDVLLADVVADAFQSVQPIMERLDHELSIELPSEPVVLRGDPTRLSQVVLNLLNNAAKFMQPGGKIDLSARQFEDQVEIVVADAGAGIDAAELPQIFDMYAQGTHRKGTTRTGLGVGLALAKGLVEMHGGSVSAESDGLDKGSRFTVLLPLPVESDYPTPTPEAREGSLSTLGPPRRVLVVDDNEDLCTSTASLFEQLGHEVYTAVDGVKALEAAELCRPDIILMDIGMPRLDGLEATRRLRQTTWGKDIPVVALTGWGQEKDRTASRQAGCQGHLVKPVKLEDVLAVLKEA
jgi:signal transduction histidine kinase